MPLRMRLRSVAIALSPEGASCHSPGQRPGDSACLPPGALPRAVTLRPFGAEGGGSASGGGPPRIEYRRPREVQSTRMSTDKVLDALIAALKQALAEPDEQRLFRSGKLPGLFATRSGANAEAAERAVRDGLLEVVR